MMSADPFQKWLEKLTERQREAVVAGDRDLWLTAGAGSGKTRVLAARYLFLHLEREVPIGRLLAITFTDKAAAEMRQRIAEMLQLVGKVDSLRELPHAPILTIDSLCYRIVREYGEIGHVEPTVDILAPVEAVERQEAIWSDLIDRWWRERRDDLLELLRTFAWKVNAEAPGGVDPAPLFSLVRAVRTAGRSLDQVPFVPDLAPVRRAVDRMLHEVRADGERLLGEKLPPKTKEKIEALLTLPDNPGEGEERRAALARVRDVVDRRVAAAALDLMDKAIGALEEGIAVEDEARLEGPRRLLGEIALQFRAAFDGTKRDAGEADFLDLEEAALRILEREEIGRELRHRYAYLLLDECQDTNELQLRIIRRLRNRGRFLAVGDAKQSIYAFRDADVSAFVGMSGEIAGVARAIHLDRNFRSRRPILEWVNDLFPKIWDENEGMHVPYERLEAGDPTRFESKEAPSVEILIAEGEDAERAREAEADRLAKRLREIHEERLDGIAYRDMAVLFRSTTDLRRYERRLRARGVPASVAVGRGFFQNREVTDLLGGLSLVDDPYDDLAMAAALRSPLVGLDDTDLAALRFGARDRSLPLWDAIRDEASIEDLRREGRDLLRRFVERLETLRRRRGRIGTWRLLEGLITETGYAESLLLLPDGLRLRANVRKLLELARELEDRAERSIPETIRTLRRYRYTRLREAESALDTERDAVRLLTVHGAKGMGFPLVAVVDLGRKTRQGRPPFLFDKERGVGVRLRSAADRSRRGEEKPWLFRKIEEEENRRRDAEEIRLLYVALTRAKRHLILSASRSGRTAGWLKRIDDALEIPDSPGIVEVGGVSVRILGESSEGEREERTPTVEEVLSSPARHAGDADGPAADALIARLRSAPPEPDRAARGRTVGNVHSLLACPRRFHLSRTFPIGPALPDEEGGGAKGATIGTAFHEMMERAWQGGEEPTAVGFDEKTRDELIRWKEAFFALLKAEILSAADLQLPEVAFCVPLGGRPLRGRIDLIARAGERWIVVDYKTDRKSADEIVESYRISLALYAEAARLLTAAEEPVAAWIYAAREGRIVPVSFSPADVEGALAEFDRLEWTGEDDARLNDGCRHCPFSAGCAAVAADL